MMKRIFLVSYCTKRDLLFLKKEFRDGDLVVGVDQGLDRLLENSLIPHYVIGDFDSLKLPWNKIPDQCQVIRLNSKKDISDLEYALNYFQNYPSPKEIIIVNNLQGRIDHILSVVHLLEQRKNTWIENAKQKVFLATKSFQGPVRKNCHLSLIPLSKKVKGIQTSGLEYSLNNEHLVRNMARGLSNKCVDKKVGINFIEGKLLVIIEK